MGNAETAAGPQQEPRAYVRLEVRRGEDSRFFVDGVHPDAAQSEAHCLREAGFSVAIREAA